MPRITILANRIPKKVKPSGYPIRVFKCVLGLHTTIIWSYHVHITIGLPLDIEGLLTGCIIYHGLFTGCIMYWLLIHRLLFYSVVVSADASLYRNSNFLLVLPMKIWKQPWKVSQLLKFSILAWRPNWPKKTTNVQDSFELGFMLL